MKSLMINARALIGHCDVLLITLDTLRYDVAVAALEQGRTPGLAAVLPGGKWERRHTPGSFTYAAHHAFFAGFLPTPVTPGPHPRLFASAFHGSETTADHTFTFDEPDIVHALAARSYRTICIGGVGFFNKRTALGCVLPDLFDESHWHPSLGVTDRNSTANQVDLALRLLSDLQPQQRTFLFVNVSAIHQPNCIYTEHEKQDSPATQLAALAYVDQHLPRLFDAMRKRADLLCILCSDHGTAYGEEGYQGHRLAHPVVWDVPYAEFVLPREKPL